MGLIKLIGVFLAIFSFIIIDNYPLTGYFISILSLLCILIPSKYMETVLLSNYLRDRNVETRFFKKVRVPTFLKHVIYRYDVLKNGTYSFVIMSQMLLFVIACMYGGLGVLYFVDMATPFINIANKIYFLIITLLGLFFVVVGSYVGIIYFVVKRKEYFPIKAADLNVIRSLREMMREEHEVRLKTDRVSMHSSIIKELNRFRTYKEKGIYYICQSDTERIEKILSNKYPGASWEYSENGKSKVELIIRDKETNEIIYQAPIKKK